MKKNGFISITVIYSFFLVFLSLMLFIVTNMITNRNLLDNLKKEIKNDITDSNLVRYLMNHSDELNLVKHDDKLEYGLNDGSLRYTGTNPSNYLKFKNDSKVFRIIGVINGKVKVIDIGKNNTLSYDNTLTNVYINTSIRTFLVTEYQNSMSSLMDYIDEATYYVGGIDESLQNSNANIIAKEELSNNGSYVNDYFSLPYISDYIYASSDAYNKTITKNNNWMYIGSDMWFLTRNKSNLIQSFYLNSNGVLSIANVTDNKYINKVFFIKGNLSIISGTGTNQDPYIVGW